VVAATDFEGRSSLARCLRVDTRERWAKDGGFPPLLPSLLDVTIEVISYF